MTNEEINALAEALGKDYVAPTAAQHPVSPSPEFSRIYGLPRRTQFADHWAPTRTPNGALKLFPIQVAALSEARKAGGLLAPIGVGEGKTLIALLLPKAMEAKKTVLLIPPALKIQLLQVDYLHYARHFVLPKLNEELFVVAYTELSSVKKADILERIQPDLIICDEVHHVRHTQAARTKRLIRYFKAHPTTKFAGLSGTICDKSLFDFAHLSKMALAEGSPVPKTWPTLREWSAALDHLPAGQINTPPGALLKFCNVGETPREGFRRRLVETPGVVASSKHRIGTALYIAPRKIVPDLQIYKALQELRATWCTPAGEEITDILTFSRIARQMAAGFYYEWRWPRGESREVVREWLEARALWHSEVRTTLQHRSRPGFDSPLLLSRAAESGAWASSSWARWKACRDSAKPEVTPVWISKQVVNDAVAWSKENIGIIWTVWDALLDAFLAEGLPVYGAGDRAAEALLTERGDRTIVCSALAHGTGKNLQCFSKNLVVTPSSSGTRWEQLLGRTHREGQEADEVLVDVYLHTKELNKAYQDARKNAKWLEETTGNPQKLCYGTIL